MTRLSLRWRLTLAFALAMALLLAATGAFVWLRQRSVLDQQIGKSLRARAGDVTALVRSGSRLDEGGRLVEPEESFAQVLGPSGAVLDSTPPLAPRPLLTPAQLRRAHTRTIVVERGAIGGLEDGRFRLLATPLGSRVVVAGTALDDRDEALGGLRTQLLIGGPIALLLASLGGYALAAAALRPVEAMRRRAAGISATTVSQRLPVPAGDDEVARLARTLNEMLGRLEAGLERERRFVADASHELRTPLSLLKAELELALRRPRTPGELRAALESAAEETDRLVRLANDLLVLAAADEGALRLRREPVALGELLGDVAERFGPRADAAGRPVVVEAAAGLTAEGDRLRLEQALGNLVDNALRYGAGEITLEAARENGSVAVRVSDRGAGFPPPYLGHAFQRFSRAPGPGQAGAGLGLALVEAVARAHGGTATASNRDGGGAAVVVTLPPPRS